MLRCASLLVLVGLAAAPSAAHAEAKAKVAARARMDKATDLYGKGQYAEAVNELAIAYTLDPQPETLYAMGQLHVQLGSCEQAILFYERFLSTNPDTVAAAAAQEAIDTCLYAPDAIARLKAAPAPKPAPKPAPPAWYTDKLGAVLLGGGVVLGIAGVVTYTSARSDLDDADAASDYQAHAELVDSAHGKRTFAAVLGVVGVGLAGAGVTRYVLVRRASASASVGLAPAGSGGLVTWSGRF
jgi:tetratricopeptide (TPR) repeat protein